VYTPCVYENVERGQWVPVPAVQAKTLGMTTVLIQSKTMLEETGYTLERYVRAWPEIAIPLLF